MSTPFFPAWRRQLAPMGSRSASARRKLEGCTLSRIEERFAPALEAGLLQKPARKAHSRQRLYPLALSFWCWIWQILQGRSSCREVVRQVQALHAAGGGRRVESGTAAYCRARGKLPLTLLEKILAAVQRAVQRLAPGPRLLQGRRIKVADGSSVRLPDTPENRAAYPPAKNQSRKPLFPMMKLVALMGATTGAVLAALTGNCHHSELRLFLGLHAQITAGDVITADRHF